MPIRFQYVVSIGIWFLGILSGSTLAAESSVTPNPTDNRLSSFFSELIRKKSSVGGTILRGGNADNEAEVRSDFSAVRLADQQFFRVLPDTARIRLTWESHPEQRWDLKIDGQTFRMTGGNAEVDLSGLSDSALHSWQLISSHNSELAMTGQWFFDQDISQQDALKLIVLMTDYKRQRRSQSSEYLEVCEWMHAERLINFNQWCLSN
ncbi:MAG TPA: hypothetical protein VGE55_06455 [Limnobacter sp.]|uniref:hypothetical protein n=1 Tax=Limnobacter sp. TaxID=2003368 RepID=UPI002ED96317